MKCLNALAGTVTALALLLGIYVAAYFKYTTYTPSSFSDERGRVYWRYVNREWKEDLFAPAAKVESALRGRNVIVWMPKR